MDETAALLKKMEELNKQNEEKTVSIQVDTSKQTGSSLSKSMKQSEYTPKFGQAVMTIAAWPTMHSKGKKQVGCG